MALLARYIRLSEARICDIGCGNGTHLRVLVDAGAPFPVGVDLSEASLRTLLNAAWVDSAVLIKADVTTWWVGPLFDGIIWSLPPIDSVAGFGLDVVLSVLYRLTKPNGCVLLKVFDCDRVKTIVGAYSVSYDGSESKRLSRIELLPRRRSIRIRQHFADLPTEIWTEVVDTPSHEEVIRQARAIGIRATATDHAPELPGTRTYILRRLAR